LEIVPRFGRSSVCGNSIWWTRRGGSSAVAIPDTDLAAPRREISHSLGYANERRLRARQLPGNNGPPHLVRFAAAPTKLDFSKAAFIIRAHDDEKALLHTTAADLMNISGYRLQNRGVFAKYAHAKISCVK